MDFMHRHEFSKGDSRCVGSHELSFEHDCCVLERRLRRGNSSWPLERDFPTACFDKPNCVFPTRILLARFDRADLALGIPLRRARSNCESPAAARDCWRSLANDCLAPHSTGRQHRLLLNRMTCCIKG